MIAQINDKISIELKTQASGSSVNSIVQTKFGGEARNQMFWSSDPSAALAFFNGMLAAKAILSLK